MKDNSMKKMLPANCHFLGTIQHLTLFFVIVLSQWGCAYLNKTDLNESVIVLHGFAKKPVSMARIAYFLKKEGYTVHQVAYPSIKQKEENVKAFVYKQIDNIVAKTPDQKIHFVGHSLGGLLIRSYLGEHEQIKNIGHVVITGSPSKGTNFVDHYKDSGWFEFLGEIPLMLSSKGSPFLSSLKPPYYKLGVIAGNFNTPFQEHILEGKDDGLVPVESTKIDDMTDFIIINTVHGLLKYNKKVIQQIIHFLHHGHFKKHSTKEEIYKKITILKNYFIVYDLAVVK